MTPLLFAAALALSPAGPSQPLDGGLVRQAPIAAPSADAACAKLGLQTVAPDGVPFKKLNELPPGVLEHAVWRTVAGCPVREVVWKGQTYYVGPSIPRMERRPAVPNGSPRPASPDR